MKVVLSTFLFVCSLGNGAEHSHDFVRKLVTTCETDGDCSTDAEYCADGECLEYSKCKVDVDCFNPSNAYASIFCVGYTECQEGSCAKVCGEFLCKDGSNPVNCFASPCSVDKCEDAVSCADDYCGGCNSIHFNAAGSQVCAANNDTETPITADVQKPCKSDVECSSPTETVERAFSSDGSYCSQGFCKEYGSCDTDLDCLNPSNSYVSAACLGYVECQEGTCGVVCDDTGSQCKDGSGVVACKARPCEVDKCEGGVSCVDDYCGDCNAIHFDSAGNEVCVDNTFTGTVILTCTNDDDCGNEEYCASDKCMAFSTCEDVYDCANPSNQFDVIACEGVLECQSGQCTMVCDEGSADTCTSDDDCGNEEYCASDKCMAFSTCQVDEDCSNPSNQFDVSNQFGVDLCEGVLECQSEQCVTVCDEELPSGAFYRLLPLCVFASLVGSALFI